MAFAFRALRSLLMLSLLFGSATSAQPQLSFADDTVLRSLAAAFYQTWAAKDLDSWVRLWSAQAPALEASQKTTTELFVKSASITLTSFTIRRIGRVGPKAWVRVELDAQVIEAQTGKAKAGYEKIQRTLACAKEGESWKVVRELVTFDALAEAVVAASDDQERAAILDSLDSQNIMTITLNRVGALYRHQGKYELALSALQRARTLSEAVNNKAQLGLSFQHQGDVRQLMGQYEEAIEAYQQSLAVAEAMNIKPAMTDLRGRMAMLHVTLGRYDRAMAESEQALLIAKELNDSTWLAASLMRRGGIYTNTGRYAEAIELTRQALALAEKEKATDLMDACLNNLGITFRLQGDYRRSLEYLQKSLRLAEDVGDKAGIAQTLNSIGLVYQKQGDLTVAMEYCKRSLALLGDTKGRTTVDVLQNIGTILMLQENYVQALPFYEKALALAQASQDQPARARALIGLGEIYYYTRRYENAAACFQQVVDLNVSTLNNEPLSALLGLSRTRYQQNNYAQALELTNRVKTRNQALASKEVTATLGELRGEIYMALNDPQQARQSFDESIAALESLRAGIASDERGQSLFFAHKLAAYHGALRLLIQQGQPLAALVYAERSKARVILDVLRNGRADIQRAMTPTEQQQESKFKETLLGLNRQLTQAGQATTQQPQKITNLHEQLEKARLNYEVFLAATYATHPELKVQRGEAPVIQAEDLSALVPNSQTALLEYVVTESKTYLFVISKGVSKSAAEVQVYTLLIKRDELAKQTESLRGQLAGRDLRFRTPARQLYQLLLKPAQAQLQGKTSLIIVPDDKLWELPFQALLTERNRYIIETSAISYAPSLTVLREMMAKRHNHPASTTDTALLALGNPALDPETKARATLPLREGKLEPLPEAEQEVKSLGQLYGAARSKVYVGAEAREERAKTEAAQASVLHFATHGILNDAAPMYSHLVLAQGDKNEDGLLEAWEVMQLDLKADLAVLSACETARGRFGAGEGMIGLTWALFVAGVPSTVVSQWKVESASTRDLMVRFHRRLQTGKASKAEALRQAALSLQRRPATNHPFYWAGFVHIGDQQ